MKLEVAFWYQIRNVNESASIYPCADYSQMGREMPFNKTPMFFNGDSQIKFYEDIFAMFE